MSGPDGPLRASAAALLARAQALPADPDPGPPDALAAGLAAALGRFEAEAQAAGAPAGALPPARYALACVADAALRANPSVDALRWEAAARATVFEGRAAEPDRLAALRDRALSGGARYADLAALLAECGALVAALRAPAASPAGATEPEGAGSAPARTRLAVAPKPSLSPDLSDTAATRWTPPSHLPRHAGTPLPTSGERTGPTAPAASPADIGAGTGRPGPWRALRWLAALLCVALAGWEVYRARSLAERLDAADAWLAYEAGQAEDRARLRFVVAEHLRASASATRRAGPGAVALLAPDPGAGRRSGAMRSSVLPAVDRLLERAAAAPGISPLAAFDLRVVKAMRAGRLPPDADWLSGWLAGPDGPSPQSRTAGAALADAFALDLPEGRGRRDATAPPEDTRPSAGTGPSADGRPGADAQDLLSRAPAAIPAFADRALLALQRSAEAQALPPWRPEEAAPAAADVFVAFSGPVGALSIPGLHTAAGHAMADDGALRRAVAQAEVLSRAVLPRPEEAPPGPGAAADLARRLAAETLRRWEALVADLRVRPFVDLSGAVQVSGRLGAASSPLSTILEAVAAETEAARSAPPGAAPGEAARIAAFLAAGGAERTRLLFAGLNVALAVPRDDPAAAIRAFGGRRREGERLASAPDTPAIVRSVVRDTLIQATLAGLEATRAALAAAWAEGPFRACAAARQAYPFGPSGDLPLADFVAGFGPSGIFQRFADRTVAGLLDRSASPWTWAGEARAAGLLPASAALLEAADRVRRAYFGDGGAPGMPLAIDLVARSPSVRSVTLSAWGRTVDLRARGPHDLAWPGAEPEAGLVLTLDGAGGRAEARWPGAWAHFRMLSAAKLRLRDGGSRILADLDVGGQRLVLEVGFSAPPPGAPFLRERALPPCPPAP